MKEQKITIEIDAQGRLTADAEGFTGDACLAELERLLEGLASHREATERKRDARDRTLTRGAGVQVGPGRKR